MNKFEVLGTVGEGAYGLVLKCRNRETDDVVAIKKFKGSEEDESVKKTMLREVKVLKTLRDSAGIVTLLEAFRRRGRLYLVFEYVGRNLLEVLEDRPGGLAPQLVRRYSYMLLQAIHSCHSTRILHRDIKPENLLIDSRTETLKLCDFGFARTTGGTDVGYTDYVATRWYRCPELLLGVTQYDEKVDVWAVGCIVSEMSEGQPLFPGESELDQLHLIQRTLGNLGEDQRGLFRTNPRFASHTLPRVARPDTLERRHSHKINRKGVQLMKGLLALAPSRRYSSKDGLCHAWFDDFPEGLQRRVPEPKRPAPSVPDAPPQAEAQPKQAAVAKSTPSTQPPPRDTFHSLSALSTAQTDDVEDGDVRASVGGSASRGAQPEHSALLQSSSRLGRKQQRPMPVQLAHSSHTTSPSTPLDMAPLWKQISFRQKHVEVVSGKGCDELSTEDADDPVPRDLVRGGFNERQCSVNFTGGAHGVGGSQVSHSFASAYSLPRKTGKQLPRLRKGDHQPCAIDLSCDPPFRKHLASGVPNRAYARHDLTGTEGLSRPTSGSAVNVHATDACVSRHKQQRWYRGLDPVHMYQRRQAGMR